MGLLPEPFPALRTPVRPAVRVDALVLQERRLLLEVLAAGQALEQSQLAAERVLRLFHAVLLLLYHVGQRGRSQVLHVTGVLVQLPVHVRPEGREHHAWLLQVVQGGETPGPDHVGRDGWRCGRRWHSRVLLVRGLLLLLLLLQVGGEALGDGPLFEVHRGPVRLDVVIALLGLGGGVGRRGRRGQALVAGWDRVRLDA